jgi:hypothetical protein
MNSIKVSVVFSLLKNSEKNKHPNINLLFTTISDNFILFHFLSRLGSTIAKGTNHDCYMNILLISKATM